MKDAERIIPIIVLIITALVVGLDLVSDQSQGAALWHLLAEGLIALIATSVAVWLIFQMVKMRRNLKLSLLEAQDLRQEAKIWREKASVHIEGLSIAISRQLENWGLTPSEREIAFLLIKGLSMREIANLRNTNEKTARAQAGMIYQKSGLSGRADLSAYFLEDLLSGK